MSENLRAGRLPPPGGPYSHLRTVLGLVFVAGQTGVEPSSGHLSGTTIREQTEQTVNNLAAALAEAQCGLTDVVKVSVFLAEMGDFAQMNEVYAPRFREPYPVRTTVQAGLAPGVLVEIDAIAVKKR